MTVVSRALAGGSVVIPLRVGPGVLKSLVTVASLDVGIVPQRAMLSGELMPSATFG
jgi:hypothetical protein